MNTEKNETAAPAPFPVFSVFIVSLWFINPVAPAVPGPRLAAQM